MNSIIKLFGILLILSGVSLLFKPEIIFGWIENNMESTALYISAIVVRLVFGILFIVAASESKYPSTIKFFGYLFIIVAIIFIFLGQKSFHDLITSIIPEVKPYTPISGLFSIAFGSFLIYTFSSNKEAEKN